MNPTLLAREAAASIGSLDPKPCAEIVSKPYRLVRVVEGDVETWIEPVSGHEEAPEDDGNEIIASCGCVFCDLGVDIVFDGDKMFHATGDQAVPWVPCTK